MGGVIDWRLAQTVARTVAMAAPAPPADAGPRELPADAAEGAARVEAYTGLRAPLGVPAGEPVDRGEWIDANLRSMRAILDPVSERLGGGLGALALPARAAAGTVLAVEVGAISGYLAGRVLGQYEFPVLDPMAPARLLFVEPNLGVLARTIGADRDALDRWVALHEATHALQFAGVPWLRPHLAGKVRELMEALDVVPDFTALLRIASAERIREIVAGVRRGELAALVVGPERRGLLDDIQCLMAVLEGYAEHVMDAVGADVVPDIAGLRAAMDRRRRDRTGVLRILERLIGLELKMRQYEEGKAFCDAIVGAGGIEALNLVWSGPEAIPSVEEVREPLSWLARVRGPAGELPAHV